MITKTLATALIGICCTLGPASLETVEVSKPAPTQVQSLEEFELDFTDGMSFETFAEQYAKLTDKTVFYDLRRVANRKIYGSGNTRFKLIEAETVFQTIMVINELAVIHQGPESLGMVSIESIKTSTTLKANATHISLKALPGFKRPAEVVSVSFPLKNLSSDDARKALSNIIQEHRTGFVSSIPNSNSVVICGFSTNVMRMVALLKDLDSEAGTERATTWRRKNFYSGSSSKQTPKQKVIGNKKLLDLLEKNSEKKNK